MCACVYVICVYVYMCHSAATLQPCIHVCATLLPLCSRVYMYVPLCCHSAAVYDIEKPPMTDRDCYRFKTDQKRQYLTQSHNQPITCLASISGQSSPALAITCLASISVQRSPALAITCLTSISVQRSPALAITCLTSISVQRSPLSSTSCSIPF